MSAAEAVANTAIGYAIAVAATAIILPLFGYAVTGADAAGISAGISAAFTVISLARSFVLRRLFNRIR